MMHICPRCRSLVPIVRVRGAAIAQCRWCGPQPWRAVLPASDPITIYPENRAHRGQRRAARPGRRAHTRIAAQGDDDGPP